MEKILRLQVFDLFTMGAALGLAVGLGIWLVLGVCGKLAGMEVLSDAVFVGGTL